MRGPRSVVWVVWHWVNYSVWSAEKCNQQHKALQREPLVIHLRQSLSLFGKRNKSKIAIAFTFLYISLYSNCPAYMHDRETTGQNLLRNYEAPGLAL